jgi:hypothetical protein
MDGAMTPKARFFVEDTRYVDDDVILPGERAWFAAQPQVLWTPRSLTIFAFSKVIVPPISDSPPGDPGRARGSELVATARGSLFARLTALFRGKKQLAPPPRVLSSAGEVVAEAMGVVPPIVWQEPPPPPPTWELLSQCPIRLCALELSGHTVEFFTENNFGPRIDLTGKRLRQLRVAEILMCELENTSESPVRVKLGYEGLSIDNHVLLAARARCPKETLRSFEVPPKVGAVDLIWRTPWEFRATRIWCHSKDSRGDLNLLDVRVGNRSHSYGSENELPVEMFEDGINVSLSTAIVGQCISFVVENTGYETKHIEFELEGFAIDDGPFEPGTSEAPAGTTDRPVPSGGA